MNTNTITLDKKYKTGNGYEFICHTVNGPDPEYPVVGSYKGPGGWMVDKWTADGYEEAGGESPYDLIEVREPRVIWVNEYDSSYSVFESKIEAFDRSCVDAIRAAVRYVESPES